MGMILPCFHLRHFSAMYSHSIHNRILYFGQDFKGNQLKNKEMEK